MDRFFLETKHRYNFYAIQLKIRKKIRFNLFMNN